MMPRLEARGQGYVTAGWHAFGNQLRGLFGAECWNGNGRSWNRCTALEFRRRDETPFLEQYQERCELPLVVAHAQVVSRGDQLHLMSANINIPPPPRSHRAPQGEHTAFPRMVEH